MPYLPQQGNGLEPTEALLDSLPFPLADAVAGMTRRPLVEGTAAAPTVILGDMWRDLHVAALGDEVGRVKPLSPPTVTRLVPAICSSIASAVSRSAVPLASHTIAFTISPLRFSTSRLPL